MYRVEKMVYLTWPAVWRVYKGDEPIADYTDEADAVAAVEKLKRQDARPARNVFDKGK